MLELMAVAAGGVLAGLVAGHRVHGLSTSRLSLLRDITRLKSAEAAALEANRLLRAAEQIASIGHWRVNMATGQVSSSEGVYQIAGAALAGPVPLEIALAAYHPDDQPIVRELMEAAMESGADFEHRLRLVRPDGEVRHILVRGIVERAPDGRVHGLFGAIVDCTDLKRAETQVEESQARYHLIAENATDAFCRFAPDSTILWISPAVRTILGFAPEDLLGRRSVDLMHPDDVADIQTAYRALVAAGPASEPPAWCYRLRHRDGRWIWLEGRPRASFDADGRVIQLQDVVRDISDRRAVEASLEAAQIAAEAAAAAKSEFLATMSHELRTPLTSIIGYAGLLQARGALGESEALFVRRINDASRLLLTVVNDVLAFSKLEAGRTELELRAFNLRDLVSDTLALVEGQATAKGLALATAVQADAPRTLQGDPGRLRQVLLNLLSNAVKFTAEGSVSLDVVMQSTPEGSARLTFSVTDTGPGVPVDRMDRLFQRFSQADGSMSRRYGGTGLGLAICKGLIELMDGQIGVHSREGRGSRFWFTVDLPVATPARVARSAAAPAAAPRPSRILVADDSGANRELSRLMLTALGHHVTLVEDGAAAVAAVAAPGAAYDLVLMDVQMPVLDGRLATRRIRALDGEGGRLPIIALTADVLSEQIELCRAAGMDDHLAKPIVPAALASVLAHWLRPDADGLQYNRSALHSVAS
jgi:PAS domain S-box-containing protein